MKNHVFKSMSDRPTDQVNYKYTRCSSTQEIFNKNFSCLKYTRFLPKPYGLSDKVNHIIALLLESCFGFNDNGFTSSFGT